MYRDQHSLPEHAPASELVVDRRGSAFTDYDRRRAQPDTGASYRAARGIAPDVSFPRLHRVDIVIYPGFQSLDALGAISVLSYANRQLERQGNPKRYDVQLVSLAKGVVSSDTGIGLEASRSLSRHDLPHTAIIVGTDDIELALQNGGRIVEWCAFAAPRLRRIAALYSGCFFLAEAGLLDGLKATTHWSVAHLLQEKYPQIDVEEDAIFTRTGNLWTSAGVTSAVDLALAFVEEDCGRQVALDVARDMVVFSKRSGGQSQCSTSLVRQLTGSANLRELQSWVLEKLDSKISVEEMAKHSGMSIRHFARTFREKTGLTPSQFVEQARLEKALGLLEDSNLPLKTIAFHCGFASDEQMRKVFKKRLSITAREYRRGRLKTVRPQ
jgi:transcriptional regulator GlxA family with amidase domain